MRLSDDALLKIFRYYLDASPRSWPRLVHVCCKWRRVVFMSQQALHLRLFCSSGTPVSKTLYCWPPLPIVLDYGGSLALDPPAPEDEVNIIAALALSDRISSINLTVTASLLKKLCAVERPFLELDDLTLLSRDSVPLDLPSSFRWGPRLRRLHLNRIASPALFQLLHYSKNLVDLRLHESLNSWYFSIEELTDALLGTPQLRSLSLHFPSTTDHVSPSPPPCRRIFFPVLTRLSFRGPSKYLERLVLRVDSPRLRDILVTLFTDKSIIDLSRLGDFLDRIVMHKSHPQACIQYSERAMSISLTQPGTSRFKLRLLSNLFSERPYAKPCIIGFSAFLLNVEDLRISTTQASSQENSFYNERWPEHFNSFTGVRWLHLDVNNATNVVRSLQDMFPALYKLYLPHPGPHHAPLSEAIARFTTSRWRSGHPIGVEYEHICRLGELHGRGTSLCIVPLHYYVLIFLSQ